MSVAGAELVAGAGAGSLDLHGGLSTPGCDRWPKALRLVSSAGHFVPGRCRATNLCSYCAMLAAVENAECLALDALSGDAPSFYLVLTTPSPDADPAAYYRHREKLQRAIKRRWAGAEFATLVEFTTGRASSSGGARRPHWNVLVKGVPATAFDELRELVLRVWCSRVEGASPAAQYVGVVADIGGITRYLALHFQKEDQRPPAGWSGQRFNVTRGYFRGRPMWKVREEARESLRRKRELWRALRDGHQGVEAELVAEAAYARSEGVRWACVVVSINTETGELLRARLLDGREPDVMRLDRTRARELAELDRRQEVAWRNGELVCTS